MRQEAKAIKRVMVVVVVVVVVVVMVVVVEGGMGSPNSATNRRLGSREAPAVRITPLCWFTHGFYHRAA